MNGRTCECTNCTFHAPRACGDAPYSWSQDHNNEVRCKACFDEFLKNRDVNDAMKALRKLSPEQVNKLLGGNN